METEEKETEKMEMEKGNQNALGKETAKGKPN